MSRGKCSRASIPRVGSRARPNPNLAAASSKSPHICGPFVDPELQSACHTHHLHQRSSNLPNNRAEIDPPLRSQSESFSHYILHHASQTVAADILSQVVYCEKWGKEADLDHEVFDVPMEDDVVVIPVFAVRDEILARSRDQVTVQLDVQIPDRGLHPQVALLLRIPFYL